MSLAENYDPNATPASHLGWSVRYELLSAPEPVIKMVESGDIPPTRAAIREAKQEYQQAQEAPVAKIATTSTVFDELLNADEDIISMVETGQILPTIPEKFIKLINSPVSVLNQI